MKSSFACLSTIQRNNFGSNLTKTSISVKELINANENYELSVVYVVTIFRLLFFFFRLFELDPICLCCA